MKVIVEKKGQQMEAEKTLAMAAIAKFEEIEQQVMKGALEAL